MAETNEKVMAMVRETLQKSPDISTNELYQKAQKIDSSVKGLTIRQFHARYPLQVKRKVAAAAGKRRRRPARRAAGAARRAEIDRTPIRESLLAFARDVSAAEGTPAVIDVLAGVDKYVDQIVKGLGRGRK